MDEIQKTLVKAGRKDLAQKYYLKIAKEQLTDEMSKWFKENPDKDLKRMFDNFSKKFNIKDDRIINELLLQWIKTSSRIAKGKCPESGCIGKKPNGKWGVISNRTGKWWPADYDTKEDAENGLKAYHAHANNEQTKKISALIQILERAKGIPLFKYIVSNDKTSVTLHFKDTKNTIFVPVNLYSSKEIVID